MTDLSKMADGPDKGQAFLGCNKAVGIRGL